MVGVEFIYLFIYHTMKKVTKSKIKRGGIIDQRRALTRDQEKTKYPRIIGRCRVVVFVVFFTA